MTDATHDAAPQPRAIPLDLETAEYQPLLRGRPQTRGLRSGLVTLAPGTAVGRHDPGPHEEVLVVLEGEGELRADGAAPLAIRRSTAAYCPPHRPHDVVNTGRGPLRYVYVVAEAG